MKNVTIYRCPSCPSIGSHTADLVNELQNDPNVHVNVMDGAKGEFRVDVDGHSVNAMDGDSLRNASEVATAIRGSEVATAG